MNLGNHWQETISVVLLGILIVAVRADDAKQTPAKSISASEAEQIKQIATRLDIVAPRMINQMTFTMLHCAGTESIDAFIKAVGSPDEHGKGFSFASAVHDAGGLAKYRQRVAKLLTNEDIVIRGYGAQWMGIVGDDSCKEDLLRIVKSKSATAQSDQLSGFDREMAAMALGMLKAKECAKELATLLEDPNSRVRAGAATALGVMKAKEHADDIAKSLGYKSEFDPRNEEAHVGAILALVALDAKQHAPAIAKWITSHGDVAEFAIFALVALDAKEQTKNIAAVLNDNFNGGDAAVALALMGATEYAGDIDRLLKKKNDFNFARCKAAIALGILGTDKYIPDIVDLMKDAKDSERSTAAWALILLKNKEHAAEAIKIIGRKGESTFFSTWIPQRSGMLLTKQFDKLEDRAVKSFRTMNEEIEKNKTLPVK